MDFHLILSDCALEKQETKEHFWLITDTSELRCKRKREYVIFTEANH